MIEHNLQLSPLKGYEPVCDWDYWNLEGLYRITKNFRDKLSRQKTFAKRHAATFREKVLQKKG